MKGLSDGIVLHDMQKALQPDSGLDPHGRQQECRYSGGRGR